jgi:hypothetical protein
LVAVFSLKNINLKFRDNPMLKEKKFNFKNTFMFQKLKKLFLDRSLHEIQYVKNVLWEG